MVADKFGVSKPEYLALKPAAKMALLNIEAKLRETSLGGMPLLSFVEKVRCVEVDRVFLFVKSELKALIERSSDFAAAPGHGPPDASVPLPAHWDSWKHRRFGAGNIQVSFSESAEPLPGNPGKQVFSTDIDIDLERGLAHVSEWLDNHLLHPGKKTDQSQVYALLFSQGIYPEYTLNPLVVEAG